MSSEAARRPPVQFRDVRLEQQLSERADPGSSLGYVAQRDLERYYDLLRRELETGDLTEGEASLLCDALNGSLIDTTSIALLWAEIADTIQSDNLHIKWGIPDEEAFVRKVHEWTPGQTYAVLDAIERFWQDPNPADEAIRRVGLVRS